MISPFILCFLSFFSHQVAHGRRLYFTYPKTIIPPAVTSSLWGGHDMKRSGSTIFTAWDFPISCLLQRGEHGVY